MDETIFFILKCLYFMLPAYFANMAPVLVKDFFKLLNFPIDFNKNFFNKPIFGKNKTYRGLIFAVIFGIITSYMQHILTNFRFFDSLTFMDYSNWLIIGFLLGLGAILGDLVESYFKRRVDIRPGDPFIPWDQLDFVIGSLLLVSIIFRPTLKISAVIVIFSFVLHIVINHIGFHLKLKKTKH
ncbi:MAG: CDP-2,3-bis-(O-geranylgeranyl)-sn-glycerol synthase [Nanoarchaeota archaeon]